MANISTSWYLKIKPVEPWAYINDLFTKEECEKIISKGLSLPREQAKVETSDQKGKVSEEIRKNTVAWFDNSDEESKWIFRRVTDAVELINKQFWEFDLDYIEILQFTIYDQQDDHYLRHVDTIFNGVHYRKLSFSIQLSDPESYKGCDLMIEPGSSEVLTRRDRGSFIAFPSYMAHRVTDLEEGTRYSLVGWVCGPKFK